MDILEYWKLKRKAFENNRDYKFYYLSAIHREALARLHYFLEERNGGIAMVSGEIGSGKTMLAGKFVSELPRQTLLPVYLENANLSFPYLLKFILIKMGMKVSLLETADHDRYMNMFRFALAQEVVKQNRHLVLVFDEAQDLDEQALVSIKNLSNINAMEENYMSIVLIGQPELREHIRVLPQLDQRVSVRFYLKTLDEEAIAGYLLHRLKMAGYSGPGIFTKDTIPLILKETQGIPREINRMCRIALEFAYLKERPHVDKEIIAAVVSDIRRQNEAKDVVSGDRHLLH